MHVLAFAIVAVLREDMALLTARRIDTMRLADTERLLTRLIALLWLSGLALIVLDIGFDAAALLAKPKLAAKLTVVSLLTINGLLLHRIAFPLLKHLQPRPRKARDGLRRARRDQHRVVAVRVLRRRRPADRPGHELRWIPALVPAKSALWAWHRRGVGPAAARTHAEFSIGSVRDNDAGNVADRVRTSGTIAHVG